MLEQAKRCVLCLGIVVIATLGSRGRADAPPNVLNRKLAEAQLALSREALSTLEGWSRSLRAVEVTTRVLSLWQNRQIEALRSMGTDKARMVEALEKLHKQRRARAQNMEEIQKHGLGVDYLDLMNARYATLEAEVWLNQERAR